MVCNFFDFCLSNFLAQSNMSATIQIKQTKKSIMFNRLINLFIGNFNCKVEYDESFIVNGNHMNLTLPPVLTVDGIKFDNYNYQKSTAYIVEYVLSKNLAKGLLKGMELIIINSFLLSLYNEQVLEKNDITSIDYIIDNYDIFDDSFSGFIITRKTVVEETADYPSLKKESVKSEVPKKVKEITNSSSEDDFQSINKKKKKKTKKIISLVSTTDELLQRQPMGNETEQRMQYNGWYIKTEDKKYTAVNDEKKQYLPIMFNLEQCISDANEGKVHHLKDDCKLLFCKFCHNVNAVKEAIKKHDLIVKNGNFSDAEIRNDKSCRVLQANTKSRCGQDVYNYHLLLTNLAEGNINSKFIYNEKDYNSFKNLGNNKK